MAACWRNVGPSSQQLLKTSYNNAETRIKESSVACFTSHKKGHKSPEFPDSRTGEDCNFTNSERSTKTIQRFIGDHPLDFLLVTRASIMVLPKELASMGRIGGNSVVLADANGGRKEREL